MAQGLHDTANLESAGKWRAKCPVIQKRPALLQQEVLLHFFSVASGHGCAVQVLNVQPVNRRGLSRRRQQQRQNHKTRVSRPQGGLRPGLKATKHTDRPAPKSFPVVYFRVQSLFLRLSSLRQSGAKVSWGP